MKSASNRVPIPGGLGRVYSNPPGRERNRSWRWWRRDGTMRNSGQLQLPDLQDAYADVRATTERLASVLSAEDQTVQPCRT